MIADPIDACRFWLHDVSATVFTDPQIQEFLDLEKVIDADGYAPDDDDWTPTYDVLRAAGRGWLWMAGLAGNKSMMYRVGDVTVQIDKGFCLERARQLMGGASHPAPRRDEQTEPDVLDRYRSE